MRVVVVSAVLGVMVAAAEARPIVKLDRLAGARIVAIEAKGSSILVRINRGKVHGLRMGYVGRVELRRPNKNERIRFAIRSVRPRSSFAVIPITRRRLGKERRVTLGPAMKARLVQIRRRANGWSVTFNRGQIHGVTVGSRGVIVPSRRDLSTGIDFTISRVTRTRSWALVEVTGPAPWERLRRMRWGHFATVMKP